MYHSAIRAAKTRSGAGWLAVVLLGLVLWIAIRGIYLVVDGESIIPCYGLLIPDREIAARAGVMLDPLDGLRLERKGIGFLTVTRAPRVTLYDHGVPIRIATAGETVSQLLQRLDKMPGDGDVLSLPEDTRLADGMVLSLDHVEHQLEDYTAAVPFSTEYQQDTSAPWGEETVLSPGIEGEVRLTVEVEYRNGRQVNSRVLHQEPISPAQPRIISVGTSEKEPGPEIHDRYILLPDGQLLTYTQTLVVEATAYTGTGAGCTFVTATGTPVRQGTVCVDPAFIPYGTRMFIMASDGSYVYGIARAEDCRAGIDGYRADLYLPTAEACAQFGRRRCTVFVLG